MIGRRKNRRRRRAGAQPWLKLPTTARRVAQARQARPRAAGRGRGAVRRACAAAEGRARPARAQRVVVEGAFQRVSPPADRGAVADELVHGFLLARSRGPARARERIDWVDRVVVGRRGPTLIRVGHRAPGRRALGRRTGCSTSRGELFIRHAQLRAPRAAECSQGPAGSEQRRRAAATSRCAAGCSRPIYASTACSVDERGAWSLDCSAAVRRFGSAAATSTSGCCASSTSSRPCSRRSCRECATWTCVTRMDSRSAGAPRRTPRSQRPRRRRTAEDASDPGGCDMGRRDDRNLIVGPRHRHLEGRARSSARSRRTDRHRGDRASARTPRAGSRRAWS